MRRWARPVAVRLLLGAASLLFCFPFLWLLAASFKSNPEIFSPRLLPARLDASAYAQLLTGGWLPYPAHYASTVLIIGAQTLLAVAASSAAAFVFARYRFALRWPLYLLALSVLLVPKQLLVVPLLEWLIALRLTDSLWGVILPGSVSGVGLLFFTVMARSLPPELFDHARLEGASERALYVKVALPLLRPALLSYAFVHALLAWHELLLPLVVLSTPAKQPLAVALGALFGSYLQVPYALIMAGFALGALPVILAYALAAPQLGGVVRSFVAD